MKTLKEAINQVDRGKEFGMKGHPKVIDVLNSLLAHELAVINQYMVHSEMCDNWGYERLHSVNECRAISEMKHAEKLIARILFFSGVPIVSNLDPIHIGADVHAQIKNDHETEADVIRRYNEAIEITRELKDNGTRDMLECILEEEEDHIDCIEAQLDQIDQMGIQNFLAEQIRSTS